MKYFSLFLLQTESNIVIVHLLEILVNMYFQGELSNTWTRAQDFSAIFRKPPW